MNEQVGAVLVFKPGVTLEAATQALKDLKALLEYPPTVQSFDPEYGSPVFYVP